MFIDVFNKFLACWTFFIIILGIVFNTLVCLICLRTRTLRSKSTFKILAIGAFSDIFCVFPWNFEAFTTLFFDLKIPFRSLFFCKVFTNFLQLSTLEFSSWINVSISLDRVLALYSIKWERTYFVGNRPFYFCAVLAAFIFAINFSALFNSGHSFTVNGTEIVVCYFDSEGNNIWYNLSQINLYFGSIVPFVLLVCFNSIIIYKSTKFSRSNRNCSIISGAARRKVQMNRTILCTTFLFFMFELPDTIITNIFYLQISTLEYGISVYTFFANIRFTVLASNFLILYFSNKLFKKEIAISCIPSSNELNLIIDIKLLLMRFFVPFILMFVMNIFTSRKFIQSKRNANSFNRSLRKERIFTRTVICMDLTFFTLYLPWSIWYVLNRVSISTPSFRSPLILAYLNLFNSIAFNIAYLNNLSSFFINYSFNTFFKKKILEIIEQRILKRNAKSNTIANRMKLESRKNLVSPAENIQMKSRTCSLGFKNQY